MNTSKIDYGTRHELRNRAMQCLAEEYGWIELQPIDLLALLDENAKYREALEKIAYKYTPENIWNGGLMNAALDCNSTAKKALEGER